MYIYRTEGGNKKINVFFLLPIPSLPPPQPPPPLPQSRFLFSQSPAPHDPRPLRNNMLYTYRKYVLYTNNNMPTVRQ